MSAPINPTHAHQSDYGDPVIRPASPASSVGTQYPPDQTSFSDGEDQISGPAFDRKHTEINGIGNPGWAEIQAERDPLLTVLGPGGKYIRISERKMDPQEEQMLFERIMHTLRIEVARLQEDEIYEEMLLRRSTAMLQPVPTSNDIDQIMRGMMSSAMTIGEPHNGANNAPSDGSARAPPITNGPWNHFGRTSVEESKEALPEAKPVESFMSGTTAGKRSRNGTRRKL